MNQETRNFEMEKELKKETETSSKEKDTKLLSHKFEIMVLILGVLSIVILVLIISFCNVVIDNGKTAEENSLLISQKNSELQQLLSALEHKDNTISELKEEVKSLETVISDLNSMYEDQKSINEKLYADNKDLLQETTTFNSQLQEVKEKISVYEKYDYAMYNSEGKRNDLNYDYIAELMQLTQYQPVSDIDFYLSWIMIESEGNSSARNPDSTAKGFSQFLDGTSKSVYNTYCAEKYQIEWYPDIVIDRPDICLDMMVEYVNYLYRECSRSVPAMIDCYRGLHDSAYINAFERYLSKSDKSIAIINNNAEKKYQDLLIAVG